MADQRRRLKREDGRGKMKKLFCFIFLVSPYFVFAQVTKMTVLDRADKNPINGINILTETGSLIGNTNEKGEFVFDKSSFGELEIKKLMFYNIDYQSIELPAINLPTVIYLDKIKVYQLNTVEIKPKSINQSFILCAYIRSWKLVNDKLVRFGDAIVDYEVPFEGSKDPTRLQKKKYIKGMRNFKIDSIKSKSRIISITYNNNFFSEGLPKSDPISRGGGSSVKKVKDSLYDYYFDGKKIGYAIYDKKNLPSEIHTSRNFEGEEAIKVSAWWKISGKSKYIAKWTGSDRTRRPTYIFSNQKIAVDSKIKGKTNAEETVTEIFIDANINYDWIKPIKYKPFVDIDRSFYNEDYWTKEMKKHPLPSFILEQLKNVNELKNVY